MSEPRAPEREASNGAVTVVVVDDEPDVRFLVRRLLDRRDGWELVGEAADGAEAADVVEELQPDVVLLDLMMHTPGEEALPHILKVAPKTMVVVFSAAPSTDADRRRLLDLGAFAYHQKSEASDLLKLLAADLALFRRVLAGEDVVPTWMNNGHLAS
ncbi:MAG: response regulator [Nitriliruptorales bacterium]|nr:response regulator [Nitriliruptorales bacterium]